MARRPKTKLVDLCKVNTDAFRHMTQRQLKAAEKALGPFHSYKKAFDKAYTLINNPTRSRGMPARQSEVVNRMVSEFVSELYESRMPENLEVKPHYEAAARKQGREPIPFDKRVQAMKERAEKIERAIWDLQTRVGCQLRPDEIVARDAARVGDKRAVARIRKKPLIR